MRFSFYSRFIFLICAVHLSSSGLAAQNMTTKTRELSQITEQIHSLESKLKESRSEREVLVQELKESETRMGDMSMQLSATRDKLAHQRKALKNLQADAQRQQAQLDIQQKLLSEQLRAAYQLGHHEYIKLILNQENPAKIARLVDYYEYVSLARNDLIRSVQKIIRDLQTSKQAIADNNRELERLLLLKKQERHQLVLQRAYRQSVLEHEEQSISHRQSQLQNLSHNKASLEKLILQFKQQAVAEVKKPFQQHQHLLHLPTQGAIINRFGQSIGGSELLHNGILIRAPRGQRVEAIQAGKVVFADWMRGFGLLMIVDHGQGFLSLYAHNESLFKKAGQMVSSGEKIASVGHSGGFKQSALYFEIRRNGKPLNPMSWFKSATV